ncbi:MAG: cysteine desulfurase family protein [Verrucomicrobiales bacterium]
MAYFDFNATTPLCPPAREAWLRVQDRLWHNASSLYREAAAAREELEHCRERLAELTGTEDPERIVFTSGATEGGNAFFRGCHLWNTRHPGHGHRVVISPHEHPAVRQSARRWCEAETVDWEQLATMIRGGDEAEAREAASGLVVAWMAANNETGEIWEARANRLKPVAGPPVIDFCDAAQWVGKMPAVAMGTGEFAEAFVVGCAHKMGGPKGVGFLRLGRSAGSVLADGWQVGGPQEHGWRAGTEDVAGVSAMVAALEWCEAQLPGDPTPRDAFESELGWPVVAGGRPRLWNTSMVVAPRHQNKRWVARLSQRGIQCSTGSACSSRHEGDSQVLAALGLPPDARKRVLRFSSGWTTQPDEWRSLLAVLNDVLSELDQG